MLMRREHPLAALPAVAHRELAGVHLAIDGSRVNKETFCAAENSKFGLTPIIDYDVRHLDLLTSLVESNNCVSIVPAVKYKELSLQGKHPDLVFREYADGAPTAYWGIAYNKRRPLTELGQCFRAFVQSYFTSIDTRYADAQEPSAG
jgi:DNA-binding transcriptional LysR family regulator